MARKDHSYNSGRIHRAGAHTDEYYEAPKRGRKAPKAKKRGGGAKKALVALVVILAIGAGSVFGVFKYLDYLLDTGDFGSIYAEAYTPEEFKGDVINILLVGIDFEQGRTHALTDMIMYINFDIKNNRMNMLQIPRDSYVGSYSADGKINAAMTTGTDKDNPINNLVKVISDQYQLPVDRYIALDMDSMKSIVNHLGPLKVYVPKEMSYAGSYLAPGWTWMDGDVAEFFVRNRMGPGFERADIDRLDNQRYFYSALFRRFLNLTPGDVVKLLPVIEHYVNTDIKTSDLASLGIAALKLDANNIMMAKAPGATSVPGYEGFYMIDLYGRGTEEEPGLANLLNQYYREYGEPVTAEQLAQGAAYSDRISEGIALYPPNVQQMGVIQEEEGGTDVDVEPS